jgi:hypothetical protein
VITLEVPPLRERREDIPLLISHFLGRFAEELGKERPGLEPDAEGALLAYAYPGNVRELENILHRAVILARGPRLALGDLPPRVLQAESGRNAVPLTNAELKAAKARAAGTAARAVERAFLTELLALAGGNVSDAARRVGMNRSWLHQLLVRHRLDPRAFRSPGGDSPAPTVRGSPVESRGYAALLALVERRVSAPAQRSALRRAPWKAELPFRGTGLARLPGLARELPWAPGSLAHWLDAGTGGSLESRQDLRSDPLRRP